MTPSERDYQHAILELLAVLGYRAVHHRPLRTQHGWKTGLQGAGSQWWPDICAVRGSRLIVAELKSEKGRLTADQEAWLRLLAGAGVECFVWRAGMDSLQDIASILQHQVGGQANAEALR